MSARPCTSAKQGSKIGYTDGGYGEHGFGHGSSCGRVLTDFADGGYGEAGSGHGSSDITVVSDATFVRFSDERSRDEREFAVGTADNSADLGVTCNNVLVTECSELTAGAAWRRVLPFDSMTMVRDTKSVFMIFFFYPAESWVTPSLVRYSYSLLRHRDVRDNFQHRNGASTTVTSPSIETLFTNEVRGRLKIRSHARGKHAFA